jgi:hypothetical protein
MKKQPAALSVAGMAIALVALLGMRGSVAEAAMRGSVAEAAMPALTVDPDTGLPAGTLVFHVEDHTCVVLPTCEMECFCPCASEVCNAQVEVVTARPTVVSTDTVSETSTLPSAGGIPLWNPAPDADPGPEPGPGDGDDRPRGNNGLGNGEDPAPPGIARQGKPQNDDPAEPGNPQYRGKGSDGESNGRSNRSNRNN